ncbi:hypothetical protein [Coxiella-like endosymbiont]|nr:hypothetical protein [Coxiella-like endosymbiont]
MPFLWRKDASIFLGDSGSTFIGFLIRCSLQLTYSRKF